MLLLFCLKEFNQRFTKAVILQFCKNVSENQDNVSKWAAVGKNPSIIEKDDALVDIFVGSTKLYSHREKAGTDFEITNEILPYS